MRFSYGDHHFFEFVRKVFCQQARRIPDVGRDVSKPPARLSAEKTALSPTVVKPAKRRCLVVGAGKTAEEKIPTLLRSRAHVVAPAAARTVQVPAVKSKIVWLDINTRDAQALELTLHHRAGGISPSGLWREPNYKPCSVSVQFSGAPKGRGKSGGAANFSAGVSQWND
jgi:hypothetical protein